MNANEKLKAQVEAANAFRKKQIDQLENEITQKKQHLSDCEYKLQLWGSMTRFEIMEIMEIDRKRDELDAENEEYALKLKNAHAEALYEANTYKKGMLPPHARDKSTSFCFCGSIVLSLFVFYATSYYFYIDSKYTLLFLSAIGGVAGFFVGAEIFHRNFVIDESLEQTIFKTYSAHKTVRRTYFKNFKD